ncbi:adenylate/guanylate cyclase domain-containing protein [Bradyrhizobium sp. AS23.2]|uniref:adenylate/guanylate cyclase domain-containing protein n=1 Tax=Bradyrhizobium sp. AS23.2 TaxID=1680155 RepID=UPI000ABDDE66|nr:adenylate/guanylate cyclase domain-containing protein [Bradyrhizobium sp. AS23.2]
MVYREAPNSFIVSFLFTARRLLGIATFVLALALLTPKLFVLFDNPKSASFSATLLDARDVILKKSTPILHRYIPTHIAGADRSDWILIGLAILITFVVGSLAQESQKSLNRRLLRVSAQEWRKKEGVKPGSALDKQLETTLRVAESDNAVNRQDLLRVFAETKKKLDSFGREVAFLAIDVVGSTQMKAGEDPASVQYDFAEYRKLVERIFRARGVLKSAWTPDGVMACFAHVEDACQAGKDVIKSLKVFNRDVKISKADFAVRCGVNAGLVYFDDATPLETISDRVIDVAGHMQKHAEPNTVLIARKVIEPLRQLEEFTHTSQIIDGYEASVWRDPETS